MWRRSLMSTAKSPVCTGAAAANYCEDLSIRPRSPCPHRYCEISRLNCWLTQTQARCTPLVCSIQRRDSPPICENVCRFKLTRSGGNWELHETCVSKRSTSLTGCQYVLYRHDAYAEYPVREFLTHLYPLLAFGLGVPLWWRGPVKSMRKVQDIKACMNGNEGAWTDSVERHL